MDSTQYHEISNTIQVGSNKYNQIQMCDLEPFSKIQSQIIFLGTAQCNYFTCVPNSLINP